MERYNKHGKGIDTDTRLHSLNCRGFFRDERSVFLCRFIKLPNISAYLIRMTNQRKQQCRQSTKADRRFREPSTPEIELVSEKVDDGYSGVIFDRPAFKEMMDDIMEGKINCVIVKDLSRLGREYIETGRYMRRVFPAYGVRFIAINDNIDTLNESSRQMT